MNTWTKDVLDVLIKGLPETLLQVYCIYMLTKTKFTIRQFLAITLLLLIIVISLKLLPVVYGVRTLITMVFIALFFVLINRIPIVELGRSILITAIIVVLCEFANVYLLKLVFGEAKTIEFFSETFSKTISGIPSTIFFAGVVIFARLKLFKTKLLVTKNGTTIKKNRKKDIFDVEL